ncbi:hypothetical protein FEM48_Zijuj06G0072100 [Ziziphus jujuba var. spinosa]|uniref:Protein NRT1/ PTR FAMILY 4.5-like n=1 Tax=Ziziphus jujuba var. spinosa TaxID=714518 RepID=A0A978V7W8_ZIZJJ|nr:hypothetical protein FEM48_Zijuj06G0072100 [Ziziphus jujuba var. spinosa]
MGICKDIFYKRKDARRGGNRAAIFAHVMEGLENMAFVANANSFVTYFYDYMNFSLTKSANTLTNYMGTAFLLTLLGGFLSDTYLSRFKTCVLFACIELVGYALLTIQAHQPQLRPFPCKDIGPDHKDQCQDPTASQVAFLQSGLYLIALGTSGVKAALPALGADQFDATDPKEASLLASFFNWFLFSFTSGAILGVTFFVWISTNRGWDWGLGISTVAVFLAVLLLCMGYSLYRNNVPKGSPLLRILQVFVASFRNRKLPIPENEAELHEVHDKEKGQDHEILQRTDQFRFLDKAAVVSTGMRSLSTAISWSSLAFGYFLSSVVVEVVNKVSGGWLASNNLNRDKLNYFYWLLSALSVVNFGVYLMCASWYKYKKVEVKEGDSK